MKSRQYLLVGLVFLVGCASASRRRGGGDDSVDLALAPVTDDALDLAAPPDLGRSPERDLASGLVGVDLAGRDLSSTPADLASPRDMTTAPRDMTPLPSGDMAGVVVNAADTCANAPLLPLGVDVGDQDTTPLSDDYDVGNNPSTACSVFDSFAYDGNDGAYRVVIPAGKTLTVTMTHSNLPTTWDPALALVTDCANVGPSCLAGSDQVTGNVETVTYRNAGSSPLTVYVIIEAYNPDQYGRYSLRADLS